VRRMQGGSDGTAASYGLMTMTAMILELEFWIIRMEQRSVRLEGVKKSNNRPITNDGVLVR
jgi:hypothetical protein